MKNILIMVGLFSVSSIIWNACSNSNSDKTTKNVGFEISNLDTSFKPGDNFYLYAVGGWKKNHPIPDEYSIFGAFHQLDEQNTIMLKELFDNLNSQQQLNDEQKKILLFYQSGLDTNTIEQQQLKPLYPLFEDIENIRDINSMSALIGKLHRQGVFMPFSLYVAQDEKNSEMNIAQLFQGGLGLPDRDYYTENNDIAKHLQKEYKKYIKQLLETAQIFPANKLDVIVTNIYAIEEKFAHASMTRVEMRDPNKLYNKMTIDKLQQLTPNFDWNAYFTQIDKANIQSINVCQPNFFAQFNTLLKTIPLDQWKQYLKYHVLNNYAPYLHSEIEKTHFAFYGTVLSGKTRMKERWKKVVELTSNMLGEAVGKLYVQKYFPEESKQRMISLVSNLKSTFHEHIKKLDWMTSETKQKALEKLEAMTLKIGYPDKWRDYSSIEVKAQPFVLNIIACEKFDVDFMLSKVDKPVDRSEWHMYPQTVNAYYNPNSNEIVFPAAILQPPFFYAKGDDAINYGAIGAVIGHEMTHGFDDQGRQYDKNGNLNEWWTAQDIDNFKKKTEKLIPIFEAYKINDTLSVNGKLTLGENIADLGGISLSLDALKKTLQGNEDLIDGFTPIQRFFLSYANVWRNNIRQQELLRRLKEDVHAPAEVRVNVPVYQFNDFYTSFNVTPNDKLYIKPEERIMIW
ncbi:MAG: M13 family metallopeptidase [Bacteroidales bacterium]|nr:M13 family metallopeptidase [Bacteroidales bacterium]